MEKIQANPLTAALMAKTGIDGVHAFAAHDRRIVVYPCRSGQLLNVAGIHPAGKETNARDSSWLDGGSLSQLMETYQDFSEELQEMCRLAEDVKLWSLASRSPAPTFVRGKLALIGDAAHPMLPRMSLATLHSLSICSILHANRVRRRPRTRRCSSIRRCGGAWWSDDRGYDHRADPAASGIVQQNPV